MKLLNFFSTINFIYQYLPEAKAYLKPSWTSTIEVFFAIFFLKNSQVSILQLHWKKGLSHTTPPGDFFCTTGKYFTNKIEKNPLKKEKKWKRCARKMTTHAKTWSLFTSILHIFLLFKNEFLSLFSAFHYYSYIENTSFRNNVTPWRIFLL